MVAQSLFPTLAPTIEWRDGDLLLLDQTRLPHEIVVEHVADAAAVWRAIHELRVRGAPAIGVAAAYGLCVAMQDARDLPLTQFRAELERRAGWLDTARPTAVNLSWGLRRMLQCARACNASDSKALYEALVDEAKQIHAEDQALCEGIGMHGLPLIEPGSGVLTHCNAGALATTGLGTATAPIYAAHREGIVFKVFADETRPLLQGARLTVFELQQAGVDVTLIVDSAAASIMSHGLVDLVIVGTDRVAANGDFANKIGTLSVAIAANYYGIPFYVACPSSTLDFRTPTGAQIEIEERREEEVTSLAGQPIAPRAINARNPAFDVTPHELVTGFITERGIVKAPFERSLRGFFAAEGNAA
ncbi:S-methyl-5-thioribose-1-phosphate isomerase [Caballeronia sp. LP006]|uniref:S-methyl-5-thioribose-1-phosphate isomerase n=1 Tax=Caballeronia sp. LP006 TaxID=3038552 RepID=UPI00285C9DF0|nr:S-methyl-5-thioribose-1-phosphate isomerase [Caballeronia sp. LP006]MDR5828667.1 S-methyl-5-thioribose-1-phosphate isomerase [Caballeronia sp. LP006]